MALQTKSFSSSTYRGYTLVLEITEKSTSFDNNSSLCSWKLILKSGSLNFESWSVGYFVSINGVVRADVDRMEAPQFSIGKNSSLTIASGSCEITHNVDGALDMPIAASIETNTTTTYLPENLSIEGTMALTYIPRGIVYIDNGLSLATYQCYIDNGTSWDLHIPYVDNGSTWEMCSG